MDWECAGHGLGLSGHGQEGHGWLCMDWAWVEHGLGWAWSWLAMCWSRGGIGMGLAREGMGWSVYRLHMRRTWY